MNNAARQQTVVIVEPKKSVTLTTTYAGTDVEPKVITFKIGDDAVYGSYNLVYTGPITAIGPKTITVQPRSGAAKRMKLDEFAWRNYNYDAARISRENSETMHYI